MPGNSLYLNTRFSCQEADMSRKVFYFTLILIISFAAFLMYISRPVPEEELEPSIPERETEEETEEPAEEEMNEEILAMMKLISLLAEEGGLPEVPLVVGHSEKTDVEREYGAPDSQDDTEEGEYAVYLSEHITVGYEDALVTDLRSYDPDLARITYAYITEILGEAPKTSTYTDDENSHLILTYPASESYNLKWILDQNSGDPKNPSADHISIVMSEEHPTAVMLKRIRAMSLREKIGQMVFAGISGTTADESALALITEEKVGGIIFNGPNLKDPEQTRTYVNTLKAANEMNQVPLFFGIDQEGGRVSKIPGDLVDIPSSRKVGEVDDPEFSYELGQVLGEIVKAYGFNINFAPVLDINSNPQNPVIGDRSFGDNAVLVSSHGIPLMKGIQDAHIIPTIKHFPGHGDTDVDSHLALPVIEKSREELASLELIPFRNAIEAGADMVMIAHLLLPEIDDIFPSSLSETVIHDMLRTELQYKGVIITDDLMMKAIDANYGLDEAAVLSLKAGSDIVMIAGDYEKVRDVLTALLDAAVSGDIPEERINQSVRRILLLKEKYEITDAPVDEIQTERLNELLEALLKEYMN